MKNNKLKTFESYKQEYFSELENPINNILKDDAMEEVQEVAPEVEPTVYPSIDPKPFTPTENISAEPKANWCVIKCMTNNGERIGIETCDTDCEVLISNLHYDEAVSKVEFTANKLNILPFDNEKDIYLGKVSKFYIKKNDKPSGGFDGNGTYK